MLRQAGRYYVFISIHALRVEGDIERVQRLLNHSDISIHALRVEGDIDPPQQPFAIVISIHALRVEGDAARRNPLRTDRQHFYPRPPGGGRPAI